MNTSGIKILEGRDLRKQIAYSQKKSMLLITQSLEKLMGKESAVRQNIAL